MDSSFVSDPGHARAVLEVLKECDLRWFGHASFNLIRDEKLVDLMADSGCMGINIGFESLSQANIDHMHKFPNRTAEYAECIKRLHERGIGVMGTFIVGFDGDTPEVFDQIADFVRENRLETAFTLILTPKPDTLLFNQMNGQNSHDQSRLARLRRRHGDLYPQKHDPRATPLGDAIGVAARLFMAGNVA